MRTRTVSTAIPILVSIGLASGLTALSACDGMTVGDHDDEVIRLGLIAPIGTSIPPLAGASQSFVRVAQTAVEEINANGGVNGRELVLVVRDPNFDPPNGTFGMDVVGVIDEMKSLGVVGAVGPVTTATASFAWEKAKEAQFPLISPSSTGASLAEVDDGGFLFRNATNDKVQGLIVANLLSQGALIPDGDGERAVPITCAYVMHEASDYANDFAAAFTQIYTDVQGNTLNGSQIFSGEGGVPVAADFEAIMSAPACPGAGLDAPRNVVLITLDHAVTAIELWNSLDPRPNINWILSDGARTPGFVAAAPTALDGVVGTSPTNPVLGDAYEELEDAYALRFPDERIDQLVFTPQVWDGVFLFAAGLVKQDVDNPDGVEFGGKGLADAIAEISSGPGTILHAGQWRDLLAALNAGATIDFDGASGSSDFDACGESIGPYEIYRLYIDDGSGEMTSAQLELLPSVLVNRLAQENMLENKCGGE